MYNLLYDKTFLWYLPMTKQKYDIISRVVIIILFKHVKQIQL